MSNDVGEIGVRHTTPSDFADIIEISRAVYPGSAGWGEDQLASHHEVFPEGQIIAYEQGTGRITGMAASLIVLWDDYDMETSWRDFTDHGYFRNHDPEAGRTLYGAEVMVHPVYQGLGIGKLLYKFRRSIVRDLGLLRIRAGARLRGYGRYADEMTAEQYVRKVVAGELSDPTLSFQLRQDFHVLAVVPHYLRNDPASRGWAAVIEWLNEDLAEPEDYVGRDLWSRAGARF